MPLYENDSSSPAKSRHSRTPKVKVGATISTAGVATVASGALDQYQVGDYCTLVQATAGTAITGGTGGSNIQPGDTLLRVGPKISATTWQLLLEDLTNLALGVAVSAGGALQFGAADTSVKTRNIVPAGSVAGGAFGTILD